MSKVKVMVAIYITLNDLNTLKAAIISGWKPGDSVLYNTYHAPPTRPAVVLPAIFQDLDYVVLVVVFTNICLVKHTVVVVHNHLK